MTTQRNLSKVWALTGGTTDPGLAKYETGWVSEIPTYQEFNYVLQNADMNVLVMAEDGSFTWDPEVNYKIGARVKASDGLVYHARRDNVNVDPLTDLSKNYWIRGVYIGDGTFLPTNNIAVHLDNPLSTSTNRTVWSTTDLHIKSSSPKIVLENQVAGYNNVIMVNYNGNLSVLEGVTDSFPNNGDLAATPSRVFTEAHPPIQSEVVGTIPDAPSDGVTYARKDGGWSVTSATTVSTSPPPPYNGSGNLWYNLDDGRTYVDINDGNSAQWVDMSPAYIPNIQDASPSNKGVIKITTVGELNLGQRNDLAVTPNTLENSKYNTKLQQVVLLDTVAGSKLTGIQTLATPWTDFHEIHLVASGDTLDDDGMMAPTIINVPVLEHMISRSPSGTIVVKSGFDSKGELAQAEFTTANALSVNFFGDPSNVGIVTMFGVKYGDVL